jgi:hypothetical protein
LYLKSYIDVHNCVFYNSKDFFREIEMDLNTKTKIFHDKEPKESKLEES